MSDWRQEDSPKRKPKSVKAGDLPQLSPKPTGGWKGKKATSAPVSQRSSSRTWTGEVADVEAPSASALGRWLAVGLLAISAILLAVVFAWYAFLKPPKLPIFVFGVRTYESPEFNTNPYADRQREKLLDANEKNIDSHAILNSDKDDNALSALNNREWIENFTEFGNKTIKPGGPDKRIVAFYINAYAAFTSQNDLIIYSQNTTPFGTPSEQGIKLEDVLQNAASVVAKGSIAWVILDLQLPPITTNLNDLDPKWQTAAERALANVEKSNKDQVSKLLVTLPGQDGQQNWLAPEFSSSFFGYYVLQLLEGRFTKTTLLNNGLTVSAFQKLLDEKVSNRARNRRFASQNPVWLPEPNFENAASIELVTVAQEDPTESTSPENNQVNFGAIDALWKKLSADQYQRAYRWDPLGYAKVESQLLGMEDVAMTQPQAFQQAKVRVDKALSTLNKPVYSFQVSLIEDRQLDEYFHGKQTNYENLDKIAQQLVGKFTADSKAVPSFWKAAPATPEEAEEDQVSLAERPFLVWGFFVELEKSQNQAAWQQAFTPKRIEQALKYAGDETKWLEIHLLRLLFTEVDWVVENPNRPQACAKALRLFNQIQTIATLPEPEVSGWIRQSLEPVEKQFLLGFDYLLANQAKEALREFEQVANVLKPLDQQARQLAKIVERTQDALHAIPHLLAWLSKEYQFVEEQEAETIEKGLKNLGQLVDLTDEIYKYLKSKPTDSLDSIAPGLFTAGDKLTEQFDSYTQWFDEYLDKNTASTATAAPSNSPLTFRRERICLQSPFLSLDARSKLHSNTGFFLNMRIAEIVEQKVRKSDRTAMKATNWFLNSINSERDRWKEIATSDVRMNWDGQFTVQERELPSVSSPISLRAELLKREYWQRCYAAAFGASPSLHARLANEGSSGGMPWPWSCAWQRWNLAAANYRLFQVSRLSEASWGKGFFSDSSPNDQFFFYQLANHYKLPDKFELLVPTGNLTEEFKSQMEDHKLASVKRLKSLRANFGDANHSIPRAGDAQIKIDVAVDWEAVMQVYLSRTPQKRIPWQLSQPDDRIWVVHLQRDRQTRRQLDTGWKELGPPVGNLAIRGNVNQTKIAWHVLDEARSAVELAMTRPVPDGASIQVLSAKEKPPINVFFLIDCSDSMKTKVPPLAEGGKDIENVELFGLVKENVKAVLGRLADMHGREASIRLGVIPFGLLKKTVDENQTLKSFLKQSSDRVYRTKDIKLLDNVWQADVELLIDKLEPSSDTPLYDSICQAYELAQAKRDETSFIYVFSDGVNFRSLEKGRPQPISKSVDDVGSAIKKNENARLSIFHFDYFKIWIADQTHPEEWERVFDKGKLELEELKTLGKKRYGYYRSDEAQKLLQDSLATIPKSEVTIKSSSGNGKPFKAEFQPMDNEIPIAQTNLPAVLEVVVDGPFDSAQGTVEAMGGEQLKLTFDALHHLLVFEEFDVSGKLVGKPNGAKPPSTIYLKILTDQLVTAKQLGFELNFWNGSKTKFTHRPRFIVAELSQSDDIRAGTFVLADHRFMPRTHYPEVRLSEVPWPKNRPPARLRVWVSDTIPPQVLLKSIEPAQKETLSLGTATIDYENNGSSIVVTVVHAPPPKREDRIVVICPDFESSKRTFSDQDQSEKHEFMLPESLHNQKIDLQFTTIRELEEAVKMNKLTEFDFIRIDLQN